jgi:uncharacterized membrane protein
MEEDKSLTHAPWAPYAILFLGAWLLFSPMTFGYAGTALGMSDLLSGVCLIILGWISRKRTHRELNYLIGLVGFWLQMAPLILRIFQSAGYLNDTLIGVLAIVFSLILSTRRDKEINPIPRGWSYNPSAYLQRFPVIILACLCWFLARYLSAFQLGFIDTIWEPFFGQGTVQVITSNISQSFPMPNTGVGAFVYTLVFLLACHGSSQRWRSAPWLVLLFGLLVIPLGLISILLIILQPISVDAWCTVCLLTAIGMLLMIMLTLDEVAASLQLLRTAKRAGNSFWHLLWHGAEGDYTTLDSKAYPLTSPMKKLLKVLFLGCSLRWGLLVSTLIGVFFMMLPSYLNFSGMMADCDHVVGALIVVLSVISMADVARRARYLTAILAIAVFIIALFYSSGSAFTLQPAVALVLFVLSIYSDRRKATGK